MRMRRLKIEDASTDCVYHCMSRVVAGEFLLNDKGKKTLCKQMWQMAEFCGVEILTYCIMSNHFHVLIRVPEKQQLKDGDLLSKVSKLYHEDDYELHVIKNIFSHGSEESIFKLREKLTARMFDVSIFMKEVKQRFSIWYNKNHNRYGAFWADRFKSVIVEGKRHSVEMVAAYIDLNPIRAGLVKDPKDYRYSGYGEAMAGVARSRKGLMKTVYEKEHWKKALIDYRQILFGKGSVPQKAGQAIINGKLAKKVLNKNGKLSKTELLYCRIRYFSDGLIIGSKDFVQDCFEKNRECFSSCRESGPRKMYGGNWGELTTLRDTRNASRA